MTNPDNVWVPPGPGCWALDRSHYPGGTTPLSQWIIQYGFDAGLRRMARDLGAPIDTIQARFVHGFFYTRTVPLVGGNKPPRKQPPRIVLKIASRLHPEFRRRAKTAQRNLETPPGPAVVQRWQNEIKPDVIGTNRAFGSFNLTTATDHALLAHCQALLRHLETMSELHFWLHGYDLGAIARYVTFTKSNGVPTAIAVSALAGASPSTVLPKHELWAIRSALDGKVPTSLDDLRKSSPEASRLLDAYLADRASLLVTRYDFDGLTLGEMPDSILSSIVSATEPVEDDGSTAATLVRNLVPTHARHEFDRLLADARDVMDMRDDNGPTVLEWPCGLLRLSLLEVGRRLVAHGAADRPEHAIELAPDEITTALFEAGASPGAAALAGRHETRRVQTLLNPPLTLGPPEADPPVGVLPGPLESVVKMISTAMEELGMTGVVGTDPLSGVGIGSSVYRGIVRRADSPEEAFARLEPGDVLVVRSTSPAFNAVLSIAGAVITADGGAMSHAAVLARELGIAAVIGAPGALDLPDGAMVDVDPTVGVVRVVAGS
jgi:rifampicin phosphotransferase